MTKTKNGYLPKRGFLCELLNSSEELYFEKMPKWQFIEIDHLLDSANMNVNEWNKIGSIIEKNYDKYDGFVILHGTDTMAYTASALSFMLENLGKPVVITGAQIPLCEIRSDGKDNLITSLIIASQGIVNEVCIYFGGKLMRGNRAVKYSVDHLMAFHSENYPYLAEAGVNIHYNKFALLDKKQGVFNLKRFDNVEIAVLKVFPGIRFELFESFVTDKLKALVIETFGNGNIPGYGNSLMPLIEKTTQKNIMLVVCSQCPQGTVSLGKYETSRVLNNTGGVSGYDMTTEAAIAKLYYLFSNYSDINEIKRLMGENLCGELTN